MDKRLSDILNALRGWVEANVLTWEVAAQWICVLAAFFLAAGARRLIRVRVSAWLEGRGHDEYAPVIRRAVADSGAGLLFMGLVQVCAVVFERLDLPPHLLTTMTKLAVAWIVIRLLTGVLANRALARFLGLVVLALAALSIFGVLAPLAEFLDGLRFGMGDVHVSVLGILKGLFIAVVLIQAASLASGFAARRIRASHAMSPSLQVLTIKGVKIILFTVAVLGVMSAIGVDLTSLAIFSSALGVGIGFGLQTIFSNYVAGILLLMDRSIKPGDTIEVGDVFGVVRNMYGRYTSILTRDGKEYLIPNETLVAGQVINWTFSDSNVRIKIPVGVAYESDVEQALELMPGAVEGVKRVLTNPAPVALLMGFGDSSVDLELRVWIADAEQGVANVRSQVQRNIWRIFHENGIAFPFPQRDVLLKPDSKLAVTVTHDNGPDGDQ